METLEIHADAREKKKKRDAKRLLRGGKIPGILYGPKMQSVALEFDHPDGYLWTLQITAAELF